MLKRVVDFQGTEIVKFFNSLLRQSLYDPRESRWKKQILWESKGNPFNATLPPARKKALWKLLSNNHWILLGPYYVVIIESSNWNDHLRKWMFRVPGLVICNIMQHTFKSPSVSLRSIFPIPIHGNYITQIHVIWGPCPNPVFFFIVGTSSDVIFVWREPVFKPSRNALWSSVFSARLKIVVIGSEKSHPKCPNHWRFFGICMDNLPRYTPFIMSQHRLDVWFNDFCLFYLNGWIFMVSIISRQTNPGLSLPMDPSVNYPGRRGDAGDSPGVSSRLMALVFGSTAHGDPGQKPDGERGPERCRMCRSVCLGQ